MQSSEKGSVIAPLLKWGAPNGPLLNLAAEKIFRNVFIKWRNCRFFRWFFLRPNSIWGHLEHLISIRGNLEWPARSPDLTPCNFYLWPYLKFRVYVNRPRSLQDFKPTSEKKLPIYPLIRWWGSWKTPEIGLFGVWTMGDVTYLMWFSKLCKIKL